MNLDEFLSLERLRLHEERQRLQKSGVIDGQPTFGQASKRRSEDNDDTEDVGGRGNVSRPSDKMKPVISTNVTNQFESDNATTTTCTSLLPAAVPSLKTTKETANSNRQQTEIGLKPRKSKREHSETDDWITDTFYSYFPGFTNECQKRQYCLHERQLRNQENFVRHAALAAAAAAKGKENTIQRKANAANDGYVHASNISLRSTNPSKSPRSNHDKTELEIIVNNPNYSPAKLHAEDANARPSSTRHKLLQDLQHTELSQIVSSDAVGERNRRSVLMELERKKDYQQQLMQQIEDKRLSIELLRDKERKQEEALTKRLQEQLHTLQLEEQLEKEKLYVDRVRYDSENNRMMREKLLAKLERDAALLPPAKQQPEPQQPQHGTTDSNLKNSPEKPGKSLPSGEENNVYRYFSNSARREYRRGQPMPEAVELDLDLSALTEHEVEQLPRASVTVTAATTPPPHPENERQCPTCQSPLRNYDCFCLHCQKKYALNAIGAPEQARDVSHQTRQLRSFSLVCDKCERAYTLCTSCLSQSEVCEACHCKRNICLNCRRALCAVCLDGAVSLTDRGPHRSGCGGREVLQIHHHSASQRQLPVVDVASTSSSQTDSIRRKVGTIPSPGRRPPYSMNIERDSIFHPDYDLHEPQAAANLSPLAAVNALESPLRAPSGPVIDDGLTNLERLRTEADKRLQHYFNHYGDLALMRCRSTQTTPDSVARRDVVLNEDHNLSMPLLREMPRLTRADGVGPLGGESGSGNREQAYAERKIKQLRRRWEIPAVQKHTISPTTPKVLTQLGAVRKQLQAAELWSDG